jgi:uncharacterized protein YciI
MTSPAQPPEQAPPPVFVLLYQSADDVAAKAPAQFPAHKVRLDDFHARGELLMVGTSWQIRQWNETYRDQR